MAAALALTVVIALLGPSAMVPPLAGSGRLPLWLPAHPDPHLVVGMAAAVVILGTIGLAAGLRTIRIDARWLLLAGCVIAAVLAFLPPYGSADHLNYAAYGRMAVLGHDPYATVASGLPGDPVIGAVEEWRDTTSVYGPVATAVQALASLLGGESLRLTVFWLAVANAAAFVATGLLLHRFNRDDPERQRRAALLWIVNPLVVYQLAAGMHVDTLAIVFVVAALVVGPGRPLVSGALLGLGVAVKVTVGLVALGPAWELRRDLRRLFLVAGAAVVTAAVAYVLAGPHVLDQVRNASKSVSLATPWKLLQYGLQEAFGPGAYRIWIQLGSLAMLALLCRLLLRVVPHDAPGVAVAFAVAWLFATPYALPWYDGLGFALIALIPATTGLDLFLVVRLGLLSLAYLPARQQDQPPDLHWLVTGVRSQVIPWALLALTVALVWWAATNPARGRRPAASAEGPALTPRA
ncbi:DUF2029 domain-containing protein [Streptosporangiaceae bacterium NEAU-GS5]|nr:DUF2029 domain-containing protein [Streptosporangiaceae bacterium NEAU-GS5]